jgi:hypothetical protein
MAKINPVKLAEAQASLPPELREMLRTFAEDYMAASEAHVKGGKAFVNYNILAELIRAGWRRVS